jgi:undecaprenyl-diphosphatase
VIRCAAMTWLEAALLGLIQGLTEFIPVSSDGHLSAAEMLMPGFGQVGLLFDVVVHVGTLTAIVVYYRKLLVEEASGLFASDAAERRKAWWLVVLLLVATVPTAIVGLLLRPAVESAKLDPKFVGTMEIVTGLYLLLSWFRREGNKDRETMPLLDAALIGVAQGFAVLPGLSRSASTIAVGLLLGLAARWSADFTFLLAIPAILGAAALELASALRTEGTVFFATPDFGKYLLGAAIAGVTGYATIGFLIRVVATRRVHLFAIYCFLFGLALILFFPAR